MNLNKFTKQGAAKTLNAHNSISKYKVKEHGVSVTHCLSPMCVSDLASDSAVAAQWGPPGLLDIWFLCSATCLTPTLSRAQGHS